MTVKLGYGAAEEDLYLKAQHFSSQGKNILLIHFEADKKKLAKILGSHILQKPISELEKEDPDMRQQVEAILQQQVGKVYNVDEVNLSNQEIEACIMKCAKDGVTDVFIDRVLKDNVQNIRAIAAKHNVQLHCIVTPY